MPYEPTLTHRVAGQIGSSSVPLEPQNLVYDFVPAGGAVTTTRNIAVMESCNECHDDLVFHGRRFEVEYCVQCHNPDLAEGEGDMAFMIHRIHAAGDFAVLDDAHLLRGGDLPAGPRELPQVPQRRRTRRRPTATTGRAVPNIAACYGCHDELADTTAAAAPPEPTNNDCAICHSAATGIEASTRAERHAEQPGPARRPASRSPTS